MRKRMRKGLTLFITLSQASVAMADSSWGHPPGHASRSRYSVQFPRPHFSQRCWSTSARSSSFPSSNWRPSCRPTTARKPCTSAGRGRWLTGLPRVPPALARLPRVSAGPRGFRLLAMGFPGRLSFSSAAGRDPPGSSESYWPRLPAQPAESASGNRADRYLHSAVSVSVLKAVQ